MDTGSARDGRGILAAGLRLGLFRRSNPQRGTVRRRIAGLRGVGGGFGGSVYSGMVTTSYYDCSGTCRDGACFASCPTAGQTLSFQSAVTGGYVLVRNEAEGRRYGCAITWDEPSDTFDCTTGVHSGTTGSIVTLAGNGSACTASFAEIPVSIAGAASSCSGCPQCKMNCRVMP